MNTHPFYAATYNGQDFYHTCATNRLMAVQRLSLEQCRAALEVPGLQKTVITALERRIRKLEREES